MKYRMRELWPPRKIRDSSASVLAKIARGAADLRQSHGVEEMGYGKIEIWRRGDLQARHVMRPGKTKLSYLAR